MSDNNNSNKNDEQEYIFRPFITVKGVRIYPKKSKVFKIPVKK